MNPPKIRTRIKSTRGAVLVEKCHLDFVPPLGVRFTLQEITQGNEAHMRLQGTVKRYHVTSTEMTCSRGVYATNTVLEMFLEDIVMGDSIEMTLDTLEEFQYQNNLNK